LKHEVGEAIIAGQLQGMVGLVLGGVADARNSHLEVWMDRIFVSFSAVKNGYAATPLFCSVERGGGVWVGFFPDPKLVNSSRSDHPARLPRFIAICNFG
jgi:hypothetical protein